MLSRNDLKYYIIKDNTKKYDEINLKIMNLAKTYFKTMKNHSFQITQIENKLNEYNIKSNIKIKQLMQNQQLLIKELINIINNILLKKTSPEDILLGNDNKSEKCSIENNKTQSKTINNLKTNFPTKIILIKDSDVNEEKEKINMKKYLKTLTKNNQNNSIDRNHNNKSCRTKISNKNKMIPLTINSLKTIDDMTNNSELNNMKYFVNNKNKYGKKILNKQQIKKEIELSYKKLIKSKSTSEISNKSKKISNTSYSKTTNQMNNYKNNPGYSNGNYTIDEERNINSLNSDHERQTSGYNRTAYNDGSLPNLLSKPNETKKIKYRIVKGIPLKEEFYLINNYTFTNFNITNTSLHKSADNFCSRNNHPIIFLNTNINNVNNLLRNNSSVKKIRKKVYSIPYINNGIQIFPNRYTKEVLNSSYKILNKYKRNKYKRNFS